MQYSPCFGFKARGILCYVVNTFVIELKNNAYFYVILHKIFLALLGIIYYAVSISLRFARPSWQP